MSLDCQDLSETILFKSKDYSREVPVEWLAPFEYFQALVDTKDKEIELPIDKEHLEDVMGWITIQKGKDIPKPPKPVTDESLAELAKNYGEELKFVRNLLSEKGQIYLVELCKVAHQYTLLALESFIFVILAEQIKGKGKDFIFDFFKKHRQVRE